MTDKTKPEAMTAERMARIRRKAEEVVSLEQDASPGVCTRAEELAADDIPALLSALEEARGEVGALEILRAAAHEGRREAEARRDDALKSLAEMASNRDALAKELDAERGRTFEARRERAEAAKKSEALAARVAELEGARDRWREEAESASVDAYNDGLEAAAQRVEDADDGVGLAAAIREYKRNAAPPEQSPVPPSVEDAVTFAAVFEAKNRAILAALKSLPMLAHGEEVGDDLPEALDFVRARLEEALPLNEEQALYRVAPRTDDGARAQALQEAISVVKALREPHNTQMRAIDALEKLARPADVGAAFVDSTGTPPLPVSAPHASTGTAATPAPNERIERAAVAGAAGLLLDVRRDFGRLAKAALRLVAANHGEIDTEEGQKEGLAAEAEVLALIGEDAEESAPVTVCCSPRVAERAAALSGPRVLGREELLRCPVGYLEMSVRAANALQLAGVATVAELVAMTQEQVSKLRNMDDRAAARLVEDLAVYGLALADAPAPAADPLCAREGCGNPLSEHPRQTITGFPLGCHHTLTFSDGVRGCCPCHGFVPPEPTSTGGGSSTEGGESHG